MNTVRVQLLNGWNQFEGSFIEALNVQQIIDILQKLDSSQISVKEKIKQENFILKPKFEAELKKLETKIARKKQTLATNTTAMSNLPTSSQLTFDQLKLLSTAFYYAPDKTKSKGKAPYIAALLMDGKTYSLSYIKSIIDVPTSTVTFVIKRLREAGCVVDTTTENLAKNTLIHVSSISKPKSKLYTGKANSPKIATPKAQKTPDTAKNSPIIIPKKFTNLTV